MCYSYFYLLVNYIYRFYFPRHQTCEEMYKTSEHSDRPSSRDSSTASSLSPSGHLKTNRQLPCGPGMMANAPGHMFPNPLHMEAGMFPPYRMNSQPTPQGNDVVNDTYLTVNSEIALLNICT